MLRCFIFGLHYHALKHEVALIIFLAYHWRKAGSLTTPQETVVN